MSCEASEELMDRLTMKPDPVIHLGGLFVGQGASSGPLE